MQANRRRWREFKELNNYGNFRENDQKRPEEGRKLKCLKYNRSNVLNIEEAKFNLSHKPLIEYTIFSNSEYAIIKNGKKSDENFQTMKYY